MGTPAETNAPFCEDCQNTGWRDLGDDGKSACVRCADCVYLAWKRGVRPDIEDCPAIMADAIMGNYRTDATNRLAVEQAFMWLSQGEHAGGGARDLYIFGPTGTGKTRLAISLARACPLRSRYVRVPALLRQIRDGFSADEGFQTQPFVAVPLLILDDLGAEKPSAFSMQTLETLYTERMDAGKRTIFTSNLPMNPKEGYARNLVEQLDDARFLSRLFGAADQLELTGADRRLQ